MMSSILVATKAVIAIPKAVPSSLIIKSLVQVSTLLKILLHPRDRYTACWNSFESAAINRDGLSKLLYCADFRWNAIAHQFNWTRLSAYYFSAGIDTICGAVQSLRNCSSGKARLENPQANNIAMKVSTTHSGGVYSGNKALNISRNATPRTVT